MDELLRGGIVGTMCSELYKLVVTLINKTKKFSPLLEAIESTVGALESLIPQIEEVNEKLNISNKETDRLKTTLSDGLKLGGECSNDPKWYDKATCTDKLTALDESLKRELDMLTAHAARDTRETLLLARKHDKQLAESERDGKETLEMARKHGDQLVESARDGRETLDAVKEIKKLTNQSRGWWISGLSIIIIVWVIQLIFILPGERKRIATAVPDGVILSHCKVCKSVVEWGKLGMFLVRTIMKLFAVTVYAIYIHIYFAILLLHLWVIQEMYRRGCSSSDVRKLLYSVGFFSCTVFVFYACSESIWWFAFRS